MLCNLFICGTTYHLLRLVAAWASIVGKLLAGLWLQTAAWHMALSNALCHTVCVCSTCKLLLGKYVKAHLQFDKGQHVDAHKQREQ